MVSCRRLGGAQFRVLGRTRSEVSGQVVGSVCGQYLAPVSGLVQRHGVQPYLSYTLLQI